MTELVQKHKLPDCLEWKPKDFALLKARIKTAESQAEEMGIREENLKTIAGLCDQFGIPCWLQGQTLRGVIRGGSLPVDDHDDDLGTPVEFYGEVCEKLYPALRQRGFQAIRQEPDMISVLKGGRYIDICFFRRQGGLAGYGRKWFPEAHFQQLESVNFAGAVFSVPNNAENLLRIMYPGDGVRRVDDKQAKRRGPLKSLKKKLKKFRRRIKEALLYKTVVQTLAYDEFLALKIEADNSINWILRKPHLDILTDNGRCRTVAEIIDYLGTGERLDHLHRHAIVETPTHERFAEPLNLNENFWKKGNNFFFYGVYYGFRKGVVPYEHTNRYIAEGRQPTLYSARYYKELAVMSEDEIRQLLNSAPLICDKGSVIHGKHRVCAMIGRIISGQGYVPFFVAKQIRRF